MAKVKTIMTYLNNHMGRLFGSVLLCTALPCTALADSGLFLPSEMDAARKDPSNNRAELRTLCNEKLAQRSEQIRSNQMSATHRALNYDWLQSYAPEGRQYHNGRAFGKIAQKMLRQYWERKRQKLGANALIDESGNMTREYRGIDYGLTTSGGGLNFGFNYTFE